MKSLHLALILLCMICSAAFSACSELELVGTELTYTRISAELARQMMQESDSFILLDVRTYGEFRVNRIEGAILIPYDELETRAIYELPDKNILILVYCRSGRRSETAARKLIAMGYSNVYDFGGIEDWD